MSLHEVVEGKLQSLQRVNFVGEGVRERQQIQQWIKSNPVTLGEDLLILSEEYGNWEDSRRRIDLLALDEDRNLVVIEIKRTDDGGHMELQSLRYAAMIASMSFADVVEAHEAFIRKENLSGDAAARIRDFLGASPDEVVELTSVPRIVLVSEGFSIELTTTVLWLTERGLDLRCIEVSPYKRGEQLFLDFRQLLPLKEASEYQVKLRQKEEVAKRAVAASRREKTLSVLARRGLIKVGTVIEVVPEATPNQRSTRDPKRLTATLVDLDHRHAVEWAFDGARYSLTALTNLLTEAGDIIPFRNKTFAHWRIGNDSMSMWDRSEDVLRTE